MHPLSAADILRLWERASSRHPIDRALAIVAAADGGNSAATADLSLGERNRRLLGVHESTFGSTVDALASCVRCAEPVELHLRASQLMAAAPGARSAEPAKSPGEVCKLTSRDLAAASRCSSAAEARRVLASRAIGHPANAPALSNAEMDGIARRLQELDPLAVLTFDVSCPACGAQWECELDAAEFLWLRVETEALRLLRDVHALASAYGWREAEILAMSPLRRRAYVELVQ
jgi:hypothetical protein